MAINIADQYYIKALDSYPYDLSEAIESLNYALSYEPEHSGSHNLLGKMYWNEFQNIEKALYHYELALEADPCHISTYMEMIDLYSQNFKYDKALKIIRFACRLEGANMIILMHREAMIYELMGEHKIARKVLIQTKQLSTSNYDRNYLDEEMKRIKEKIKFLKSPKPSKAKSKKNMSKKKQGVKKGKKGRKGI